MLSVAVVGFPYLSVQIPPITDLAQHVSQVRLFHDALGAEAGRLTIQYDNPYWLGYLVPLALWEFLPPLAVGKWSMLMISLGWVCSIHVIAATRDRSPAVALVASLFVFTEPFYWGYFTFVAGFPIFAGWLLFTIHEHNWRRGWRIGGHLLGLTLLYYSHILWLAVGLLWLGIHTMARTELKAETLVIRGVPAAIAALVGIAWYLHMPSEDLVSRAHWVTAPWDRVISDWLVRSTFGMVRGSVGYIVGGVVLVWAMIAAAGIYWPTLHESGDADLRTQTTPDSSLLLAAALLFALVFFLPGEVALTISFASRWVAPAFVLLLLGLPSPPGRRVLLGGFAAALVVSMSLYTADKWVAFEQEELTGLQGAVAAVENDTRVLGLDLKKYSPRIWDRPYMQMFAYSQVLNSADLNFSFADRKQFPVIYDPPRKTPWSNGLEWYPKQFEESDLQYFSHVIVNARPKLHRRLSATDHLLRQTQGDGYWQAYRVIGEFGDSNKRSTDTPDVSR